MNWLEILGILVAGFIGMVLLGMVVLCLFVIARQTRGIDELKKANKALAEQVVAQHEMLGKLRVPVNLSISEEQIANLAFAINNVRNSMNAPKEQVH